MGIEVAVVADGYDFVAGGAQFPQGGGEAALFDVIAGGEPGVGFELTAEVGFPKGGMLAEGLKAYGVGEEKPSRGFRKQPLPCRKDLCAIRSIFSGLVEAGGGLCEKQSS